MVSPAIMGKSVKCVTAAADKNVAADINVAADKKAAADKKKPGCPVVHPGVMIRAT